jgi:hypothetical protein
MSGKFLFAAFGDSYGDTTCELKVCYTLLLNDLAKDAYGNLLSKVLSNILSFIDLRLSFDLIY